MASLRRLRAAYPPWGAVDLSTGAVKPGGRLQAASNDHAALLSRIEGAAHPFAALGIAVSQLQGGVAVARRALADAEEQLATFEARGL